SFARVIDGAAKAVVTKLAESALADLEFGLDRGCFPGTGDGRRRVHTPGKLGRPQQQRIDACEIDVVERDLQRVVGATEAAVRGDSLIAARELEIFHCNDIVLVLD